MNHIPVTTFSILFFLLSLLLNFKYIKDKYNDNTVRIKKSVVFADELNKPLEIIIKIT